MVETSPTLIGYFLKTVAEHGDSAALLHRAGDRYEAITWAGFAAASRRLAAYLVRVQAAPQDHVAIWSDNRPEWHMADIGILMVRCRPAPVYLTMSAAQAAYVLGHSESRIAIVENAAILERLLTVREQLPNLRQVIVIEGLSRPSEDGFSVPWAEALRLGDEALLDPTIAAEVERRIASVSPDDVATLIYTSGTTGPPKAVILTHANFVSIGASLNTIVAGGPDQRVLSYLPLAHIAERLVSEYRSYMYGNPTYFLDGIPNLAKRLAEVRPTQFFGVPRVWEKMAQSIKNKIAEAPMARRRLALWALGVGERVYRDQAAGRRSGAWLGLRHRLADRLVLAKIRRAVGLDEANVLVSGAAPIAPEVLVFFRSLGLEICEVYGQTEDCAVSTLNLPGRSRVGTVGMPPPGVEIGFADDGEVLVRGGQVFTGYYKDAKATQETLIDGWLHTGDVGELDQDGYLRITDRKKDLIITAGGKNIAPSNIENELMQHPLVSNAVVIGDRRPYVTALLTLDPDEAKRFTKQHGLDGTALTTNDAVQAVLAAHVKAANSHLNHVEQVKKWRLLDCDFCIGDELTPTLKVKRKVVAEKYASEIEALYA